MSVRKKFILDIMDFYRDECMSVGEATKYTKMYIKNFPNLWSDGDSLDREKVYELFLMGRADALAREHKEKEEYDE
jgi:acyl-coenzyme A synthetase/AMP-(fatty) acid ligase